MMRINTLIDRIKQEEDIECRKIDFVAVRARIRELSKNNPGNARMNRKSEELILNLQWLAHIDHPGHDDSVYIEGIEKAVRELHAPSGVIFREEAAEKAGNRKKL